MIRAFIVFMLLCKTCLGQVHCNEAAESYVNYGNSSIYNITSSITISAWVKGDTSTMIDQFILNKDGATRSYYFGWASVSATLLYFNIRIGGVSRNISCAVSSTDNIRHYCATRTTDGDMRIYVDGVIEAEKNYAGIIDISTANVYAGFFATGRGMNGILTDVRLYSRALTEDEVKIIATKETSWHLADDPSLILRGCIVTNNTGNALTGVANNLGSGPDGVYTNSPISEPWPIQITKPQRATINID